MIPSKAFILAAGFGTRMRPLSEIFPKPCLKIDGRSLIHRTLDHLEEAGIEDVVVNTHYLAHILTDHLAGRTTPHIILSPEKEILNTGGGIKNALEHFDKEPFFVLSGDGLWEDGPSGKTLEWMAELWHPGKMDILLLLQPVSSMILTKGVGDYDLNADGTVVRSLNQTGAYMFTSMRINHPGIFATAPEGAFSYLDLMDQAENRGRLYGLVHDGDWHHISTPDDLFTVNEAYRLAKKVKA